MKTNKMLFLQNFIQLYLPERNKLVRSKLNELTTVTESMNSFFKPLNIEFSTSDIFKVFSNLSYPISVVEPMIRERNTSPYKDTNSRDIYISIKSGAVKKLLKHKAF